MINFWKHLTGLIFMLIIIPLIIAGLTGCDSSSDSYLGDGWDFGNNNSNLVVAMGDSITYGALLTNRNDCYVNRLAGFLEMPVVNGGVEGATSGNGMEWINGVLDAYEPGFLIIDYGDNDIIHGYNFNYIILNLRTMCRIVIANKTIPVIATLTPTFFSHAYMDEDVIELNNRIRAMAEEEQVHVADLEEAFENDSKYLMDDGLHPNELGHALIAVTFYDVFR